MHSVSSIYFLPFIWILMLIKNFNTTLVKKTWNPSLNLNIYTVKSWIPCFSEFCFSQSQASHIPASEPNIPSSSVLREQIYHVRAYLVHLSLKTFIQYKERDWDYVMVILLWKKQDFIHLKTLIKHMLQPTKQNLVISPGTLGRMKTASFSWPFQLTKELKSSSN